jgi:transaldolase
MEPNRDSLKIKIFADGADLANMIEMASKPFISGLTTNPTLMKKAGVTDYAKFGREVLLNITTKPISFEVFSDDLLEMKEQALKIANWGENVYVKIPFSSTSGESTKEVIRYLSYNGVKVNVTALMTSSQVLEIVDSLNPEVESYVSVFAGRIADTGRDPLPIIQRSLLMLASNKKAQLIWASPRELLNIFQANDVGCHIITATNDILQKLQLVGKDLDVYSLDTVKMFYNDAKESGFRL